MQNEHHRQTQSDKQTKISHILGSSFASLAMLLVVLSITSGGEKNTRLARAFGLESSERAYHLDFEVRGVEPIEPVETGSIEFGEGALIERAIETEGGSDYQFPIKEVWQKRDVGVDVNAIIAHASRVSDNDLDFIATLDKENAGSWDTHIKNWNRNGTYDQGICQFNSQYFMHIINDPEFGNPEWQVNRCLELYRGWEARGILHLRFYAYPKRETSKKNFYLTSS